MQRPVDLTISIVTSPSSAGGSPLSLENDVELVKAALLYADHVELVSPGAVMLAGLSELASGDGSEVLGMLGQLNDETLTALGVDDPQTWRQLAPVLPGLLGTPLLDAFGQGELRRQAVEGIASAMAQMRHVAEEMLERSGASELAPAFESGVLTLSTSGFGDAADDIDHVMERYLEELKGLLQNRRTRLLFDDQIAGLVRAMVDEGAVCVPDLTLRHAAEAAVGSGFIARLASFPQAPVDELLDVRKDLQNPLKRYRRAVMRLESRLSARPFDPQLAEEIDDLWREEVAPALAQIEEEFSEHGLVREVARSLRLDVRRLIREGAALYVGLDTLSSLDDWVSALAAAVAPLADATVTGAERTRTHRRQLEQHELFFLYDVQQRLA